MNLCVRVNDELALDAGTTEELSGPELVIHASVPVCGTIAAIATDRPRLGVIRSGQGISDELSGGAFGARA
jgi:hypothetical protein